MNPNVKYQQATNLTLSYFMQDSQKLAFTNESLPTGSYNKQKQSAQSVTLRVL